MLTFISLKVTSKSPLELIQQLNYRLFIPTYFLVFLFCNLLLSLSEASFQVSV